MPARRGKTAFIIGGLLVLVVGIFVGAFLVLQSQNTQGQFFAESQVESFGLQATQVLLEELNRLRQNPESFSGQRGNITQEFLVFLDNQIKRSADQDHLTSPMFLEKTILPFLLERQNAVISNVPESVVKKSTKASPGQYLEDASGYIFVVAGTWQKIIQLNGANITSTKTTETFQKISSVLNQSQENLKDLAVPLGYVEFHRRLVSLVLSLQTLVDYGILKKGEDPLKGILAIAMVNEIQKLGIEVTTEFNYLASPYLKTK